MKVRMLRQAFIFTLVIQLFASMALAQMFPSVLNNSSANTWRWSNDAFHDAYLKVPNLIAKYHYPIEVHSVTTPDGYILEMHRIPHGRNRNNVMDKKKPVIFLMHGLLCSSSVWVLMGPGSGLAYILAEEGYDVWMGNARGNIYSRHHVNLSPDAILNAAYWSFSWDEIGNIDLPKMIDYVLHYTRKQRLHYIGHSLGTTTFFVMISLHPEYNDKIISMHALAPMAYMENSHNLLLKLIAPFANNIETIDSLMGIRDFLPNKVIYVRAGQKFCRDEAAIQPICSNIMFLIGGWNEALLNTTMLPTIFGHLPAGGSVRQLVHYAQGIRTKQFRRYDHGSRIANKKVYSTFSPPKYDLGKITTPVVLYYADNDPLVHVKDVDRLYSELDNAMGKYRVPLPTFTHYDYVLAINTKELIYNELLNLLAHMDAIGLYGWNDWDGSKTI